MVQRSVWNLFLKQLDLEVCKELSLRASRHPAFRPVLRKEHCLKWLWIKWCKLNQCSLIFRKRCHSPTNILINYHQIKREIHPPKPVYSNRYWRSTVHFWTHKEEFKVCGNPTWWLDFPCHSLSKSLCTDLPFFWSLWRRDSFCLYRLGNQ